jgi:hypothetical protein
MPITYVPMSYVLNTDSVVNQATEENNLVHVSFLPNLACS